jgi:hypothetical protein
VSERETVVSSHISKLAGLTLKAVLIVTDVYCSFFSSLRITGSFFGGAGGATTTTGATTTGGGMKGCT